MNLGKKNKVLKEWKFYWEYYDEEMKEFVGKFYKKDIEIFGYKFND